MLFAGGDSRRRSCRLSRAASGSKRRLLTVLLAAVFWIAGLEAQAPPPRKIIRKISIQGLTRESESDLLSRLTLRVGEVYEPDRLSEEAGNLYKLGKFRKVETPQVVESEDGVAITFVVEERPMVEAVVFRGRKQLSESYIRTTAPALRTKERELFNDLHATQDVENILEKYHDDGYIFAQIRKEVALSPQGAKVTFIIEEGTRVRIREVRFVGNKSISSGDLLGILETREKDFWFFGLLRKGFYRPEALEDDLVRIERYYQRFGHFDSKAEIDDFSFDPGMERLTITIRIREGPVYIFRGYDFKNNAVFSSQTLLALTTAMTGKPFSADALEKDQQQISNYYFNRAYIFAKVSPKRELSLEGRDVRFRFEIEEKNEIYVEEIKIQGNVKTDDKVVRRELEFYPGERVDWSKFTKSRSNLNRLQIFKNVDYSFEDGSSPGQKNVLVKVEEQPTGRLILGFGVTSGFGLIGNFAVVKKNFDVTDTPDSLYDVPDSFTGAGQTLILTAQPGTSRSLYRFTWIEPYIFDTRNALTISGSKLTWIREDYDEDRATFAPRISHAFDFDRDFVFSLGHRLEEVEISHLEADAPQDAVDVKGHTTIIALNTGVSYDKVLHEYLEGPYDGTNNALAFEYGGGILGGDVDFYKGEVTDDFYFPVYTHGTGASAYHHVISLNNRFGIIEPQHTSDEIPIFERFFLGGANTVRGFEYRGLGPHDGNDPIGGTAMLWGNLEYTFPIFQKYLRGVIFFDYGNLSPDLSTFTFSEMRFTAGGGLRINFPFLGQPLPIGLYFGVPIKQEDEDEDTLFLFTIGAPF